MTIASVIMSVYNEKEQSNSSFCIVPFGYLNILPDLRITICRGFEVGNLNIETSIAKIWQSDKTTKIQEWFMREKVLPLCFRCCALNYNFVS